MRLKLTPKIFLLVASVLVLQFILVWIFGNTMTENIYLRNKRSELLGIFREAKDEYDASSDQIRQIAFKKWAMELQNQSTTITVWDDEGFLVTTTSLPFIDYLQGQRMGMILTPIGPQLFSQQIPFDVGAFENLLQGGEFMYLDNISLKDQYGRVMHVNTSRQDQMFLFGTDGGSAFFLLETPLDPIQAAAGLAVRSFLIISVIVLALGLAVTAIVTYYTVKPIRQMKLVAGNLAEFDFSKKVEVGSKDEVGELGESINRMSEAIQRYLSELSAANDQLKLDIEERERSEQAQKQLVSNISHELKTPLALISGYAEGLRGGMAEDSRIRDEYCDVILDESRMMAKLLHQLLGLARLQSGIGEFAPEPVDFSELADDLSMGFSLSARQRNVDFKRNIDRQITVLAERDACEQVLRNFLANAMKHASEGGEVEISLHEAETGRARIEVSNSGPQIPEKLLDRVWESFFRADEARNRESGEVGLGLSIVKAHMVRHSMPYGVFNTEKGVTFFAEFERID